MSFAHKYLQRRQLGLYPFVWSFVIAVGPSLSLAAGTIFSTGFEAPYAAGPLQGQPAGSPKWVTFGSGSSTATIESSIVNSGSQAVQVVKAGAVNTDRRWTVPVTGYPSQRYILIDWDMRVAQPSTLTGFGPFFGMEAYDATISPYLLGSLGVDATTGDVLYQAQDTGALTTTGSLVNFNQWYHYRLVMDFNTDTYRGYFNGALVASTGFVDRAFGLNHFTDADIAALAAAEDSVSQTLSATAWFDNYTVRDGLPGDYDLNGVVDSADYARWRSTFGNTVSPAGNLADGNGNGVVDATDYVVWRDNLGESLTSGAALSNGAVPEPTSLVLVLAAPCWILVLCQRIRDRSAGAAHRI
jgi:hypothetical protein